MQAIASLLDPFLPALIDDFYSEIDQHPNARKVITGSQPQIDRLKASLIRWLRELLAGPYEQDYVIRRWQVGWRRVEIGLDQIYTNVALSRLRTGLVGALDKSWSGEQQGLVAAIQSLTKLLDLDLARSRMLIRASICPDISGTNTSQQPVDFGELVPLVQQLVGSGKE